MVARVVILTLALLVFWAGSLQVAGAQEGASRQEVINEVSRVTGLSSDIIAQTLGDSSQKNGDSDGRRKSHVDREKQTQHLQPR